jgi:uncharacterized membrane protein YeaQ/YmgE (transglycosylase-associated protein family)
MPDSFTDCRERRLERRPGFGPNPQPHQRRIAREADMLWILFVGFVAGIIARMLAPGPNNPTGFILTIVLGIAGAFLATFVGQMVGWYRPDQGAGFIAATVGALVVLFIWHRLVASGTIGDPGTRA